MVSFGGYRHVSRIAHGDTFDVETAIQFDYMQVTTVRTWHTGRDRYRDG